VQRIKILDSTRGIAAVMILFHHVFTRFPHLFAGKFPAWLSISFHFISSLNVEAVMLFFFLSGFCINLSLKNEMPITRSSFNTYAYRRLKRILPLYYFAILFTFICGLVLQTVTINDDFSLKNLLGNIFFLQSAKSYKGNWFAPYGDNGPFWSLSFEIFYYFFLPVFLLLILNFYKSDKLTIHINRRALVASFFISLACTFINKLFFVPYIAFASLFCVWYGGFFVAALYLERKNQCGDIILLLLLAISSGMIYYVNPTPTCYQLFFGAVVSAGFYPLYLVRKKIQRSIVATSETAFNFLFYKIGTGSYALYLLHYPLLMVLKQQAHLTLFQLIVVLIIFTILCIFLERYFVSKKWLFLKFG
jgi:peptidoglycan/LPS O-acetylase OafA/YrhL